MSYKAIKKRTYEILEKAESGDSWSQRVDMLIVTLILLNVAAVIFESVQWLQQDYGFYFHAFELFSIGVFSIEYLLRLWSITEDEEYAKPITGRLRYIFTLSSFIDLLAVVPAYLPLVMTVDGRVLRMIRILRLLRTLKLSRYNKAWSSIRRVLKDSREQLFISLSAVLLMLIIASCMMYYIEKDVQPEAFSSIPATMWWGVATLTTVGYGDIYPITPMGKLVGGIMAILGVGLFALPAGILANGFGAAIDREEEEAKSEKMGCNYCPNCGTDLKKT